MTIYQTEKLHSALEISNLTHEISMVCLGEICLGKENQLVPDVRIPSTLQLYDSTTNNVADPAMFITYHDAQVGAEGVPTILRKNHHQKKFHALRAFFVCVCV